MARHQQQHTKGAWVSPSQDYEALRTGGLSQAGLTHSLTHCDGWLVASIAAMTFISIPIAKNVCRTSSSAPDSRGDLAPRDAELASGDLADLGVVAGGVRLHLQQQLVPVAQQLAVAVAHPLSASSPVGVADGLDEGLPHPAEAVLDQARGTAPSWSGTS